MIAEVIEDDDHFSFEDSERFEEDSLCSLPSENGSLNHKWRGWEKKAVNALSTDMSGPSTSNLYNNELDKEDMNKSLNTSNLSKFSTNNTVVRLRKLEELAARKIARTMSFETIESTYKLIEQKKIPEYLFLLILKQSFPESEKDICLYSCLENTHANQFAEGEQLYRSGAVHDVFQIGYHVSAEVHVLEEIGTPLSNTRSGYHVVSSTKHERGSKFAYNVSIRVDKCKIVSCKCSCLPSASWCQHIVAVCLKRLYNIEDVQFRMTVWDSVTSLEDNQVKKLAQYLINSLPREYLPVAQKLIDELQDPYSEINKSAGAPDPTADGQDNGLPALCVALFRCMNEKVLHDNILRILINFIKPSPTVCDVQYLSSSSPPASNEWNVLIRPLRSKDPEALWNLLSIVREMMKRDDENVSNLLHIITEDCIGMDTILIWWYQTTLIQSGYWHVANQKNHALHSHVSTTQYNAASLCDEIVKLWRLIALNPKFKSYERDQLASLFQLYHRTTVHRIWKIVKSLNYDNYYSQNIVDDKGCRLSIDNITFTEATFPGFFPALQACYIDWNCPEICRIVNDLHFYRIDKILQLQKTIGNSGIDGDSYLECRNIPLLRYGVEVLLAGTMDHEPFGVYDNYMGVGASAYEMRANSNNLRRKSKRKKRKNVQKRRDILLQQQHKNANRHQPPRDINPGGSGDSEDSIPDDVDEDLDDGPTTSQGGNKKSKLRNLRIDKHSEQLDELFASAHVEMNSFSIRFVCCEALLSHGYSVEAFKLARVLAQQLLQNPPNTFSMESSGSFGEDASDAASIVDAFVLDEQPISLQKLKLKTGCNHFKYTYNCDSCMATPTSSGSRFNRGFITPNPKQLKVSELVTKTLSRTIFLVKILISTQQSNSSGSRQFNPHALALELSLRILNNPRCPAATKSLEEHELLNLLYKIELYPRELTFICEFASDYLKNLKQPSQNRITVPPLTMSRYILNALINSPPNTTSFGPNPKSVMLRRHSEIKPEMENLALKVALETLGMRVFISEVEHPMLCECIRRQRGDLAMTLLASNRDSPEKLGVILDKVLDSDVHRMYSDHTSNAVYFLNQTDNILSSSLSTSTGTDYRQTSDETCKTEPLLDENHIQQRKLVNDESSLCDNVLTDAHQSGSTSLSVTDLPKKELKHEHDLKVKMDDFTIKPSQATSGGNILPLSYQATEAQAHFMVELAKRVLTEAGGNQSNTIFNNFNNNGNNNGNAGVGGPHRYLHISSFIIGLYALGLNNSVSSTWPTRTYSTHVSWIQTQALEIGRVALQIVRKTWEIHLTPTEVASLADKASQSSDPGVVEEGALLALSVLPKAFALTAIESKKALNQCKDQSPKLLEQACLAVERAAEKDGVYPEVLFKVAHHWYNLHIEYITSDAYRANLEALHPTGTSSNSSASSSCSLTFNPDQIAAICQPSHKIMNRNGTSNSTNMHPLSHHLSFGNNYSHPPPSVAPILNGNQFNSTSNSQIIMSSSQQQQAAQVMFQHYANAQQYHYDTNSYNISQQQSQQQSMPAQHPSTMHLVATLPSPQTHLMTNPHLTSVHTMVPQGQIIYSNTHLSSQHNVPSQPQHFSMQHQRSSAENNNRLHVSHSAPNLQPNGNFTHPPPALAPSVASSNLSQPPLVQLQPQFQNTGWPQNTQGLPYNYQKLTQHQKHSTASIGILPQMLQSSAQQNHRPQHGHQQHTIYYANVPPPLPQQQQQLPSTGALQAITQYYQQQPHSYMHPSTTHLHYQQQAQQQQQQLQKLLPTPTFLINAHRVGMRAMDTMGLRNADDCRSFSKYSRTPMFCDEIRWLFEEVSVQLGDAYVHSFCEKVSVCVASPFLLFHLVKESIKYFRMPLPPIPPQMFNSRMPSAAVNFTNVNDASQLNVVKSCAVQVKNLMIQQMYPHSVAELMRNCVEMLYEAAFNKLHHSHFTDADVDDTCELALTAREAFGLVPQNGKSLFDTFVRFARMQKACKKDVIQRVNETLLQKPDQLHSID